jgi:N-acetylmuramoyl-L-alanine amidase
MEGGSKFLKKFGIKLLLSIILIFFLLSFFGREQFLTSISPLLIPGCRGSDVEQMQQMLKNWGYFNDDVDGSYDLNTFLAVRGFQDCYGLPASGIADKYTLMAMGLRRTAQSGTAYAQGGIAEDQLLARAINGEARGESYEGQVAVGAVILNRTRDSRFPKTIAGVIYQPGAFTAVSDGQINVPIEAGSNVLNAARDALNGWDPTGGCVYYWNPATATSKWIWSRQIVKQIGKHYFGK